MMHLPVIAKVGLVLWGAYLVTKKPKPTVVKQKVTDVAKRVVAAVASGDPDVMADTADMIETEGYRDQAGDLRRTVRELQTMGAKGTRTQGAPSVQAARKVLAESPAPIAARSLPAAYGGQNKDLAAQVSRMLATKKAGQEDRTLLKQFQAAEGLEHQTGLYGSETALALAERYGIVPVKPRHWGTKAGGAPSVKPDKEKYRARLVALAKKDPTRAEEFDRAGRV